MLYFIPTPIGNKEDVTVRALRLLRELTVFFCEDTATTKKLMNMYDISLMGKQFLPFTSFTDQSKINHYENIMSTTDCGVLSEAGTPWLSDPGKSLIKLAREKEIKFEVLPGANALIPTVVAAYCDTSTFYYYGFLPTKKGRQTALKEMMAHAENTPVFFYESVHRVEKLLEELVTLEYEWVVFVARELSKMFEQKLIGTPKELLEKITAKEFVIKGEFVIWLRKN